jgi:acyl-CoA synthetase (AMP-forming)/AMP-acid ligase II
MGEPYLAVCPVVSDTADRTAHVFTFDGYLRFWAEDRPGRPALDTPDAKLDFAELDRVTTAIAGALREHGIGGGDRIAWQGRDAGLFFQLFFGAARAGVVMVPIEPDHGPDATRAIAEDAGIKALFLGTGQTAPAAALAGLCSLVRCFDADETRRWIAGSYPVSLATPAPNTAVLQLYDPDAPNNPPGNSPGNPPGVLLSHCNLLGLRKAMLGHDLPHVAPGDDETLIVAMPFWRIAGIGPVVMALAAGLPAVIRDPADPAGMAAALAVPGMTRLYITPTGLGALLAHPDAARCRTVRYIACGPDPVAAGLRRAVRARLGASVVRSYGRPETAGTIAMLPPDEAKGSGAVGRALPGVEIRIVGTDGLPLPTGTTGAIAARSSSTMLGYWNRPEATAMALTRDGWVLTGDSGHLDAQGVLYV